MDALASFPSNDYVLGIWSSEWLAHDLHMAPITWFIVSTTALETMVKSFLSTAFILLTYNVC